MRSSSRLKASSTAPSRHRPAFVRFDLDGRRQFSQEVDRAENFEVGIHGGERCIAHQIEQIFVAVSVQDSQMAVQSGLARMETPATCLDRLVLPSPEHEVKFGTMPAGAIANLRLKLGEGSP